MASWTLLAQFEFRRQWSGNLQQEDCRAAAACWSLRGAAGGGSSISLWIKMTTIASKEEMTSSSRHRRGHLDFPGSTACTARSRLRARFCGAVSPAFLRDGARLGSRRRDAGATKSLCPMTRLVVSDPPDHIVVRRAAYTAPE